ncbi:MAG: hypothetical protein KKG60_02420 [Nanoarchaeota archaeon]|nr:hypothetical protein [Nanoarchaeota archaeon]
MYPLKHFIACIVLFVIMFPIYKFWALVVFVSGFLIDFDHYLWYIFRFKSFDLMKCYRFCACKKNVVKNMLHIFHTAEAWILIGMVGAIFYKEFEFVIFPFLFSLLVHLIMDFIYGLTHIKVHERALSFFEWMNKRKSRRYV